MQHVAVEPTGSLAGIVAIAWYLDLVREHRHERVLPLPHTELILNLSDPYLVHTGEGPGVPSPPVFLTGVRDRVIGFDNPARIRHLALRLELWGPSRLGLLPGDGVTAVPEPLATALREAVGPLGDPLPDADARAAVARVLAETDRRLLPESPAVAAVRRATGMLREDSTIALATIADRLGVTHKTLIAHFRRVTGTTPGRVARILMLHDLVTRVPADGALANWAELVAGSGYADQSHFIRVFGRATGMSPRGYLRALAGSRYGEQLFLGEGPAG